MKYEAAKCPSCGAQLQLDSGLETGFCVYCGSKILVHEAIQNMRIEVSGNVNIVGISTSDSDILLGQHCISVQDWVKAANSFRSAIEKNANDFNAWYGCLEALTECFSTYKQVGGLFGFESAFKNCLKHGDSIQRNKVLTNTKGLLALLQQREDEMYHKNIIQDKEYSHDRKKGRILNAIFIPLILSFPVIILSENETIRSFAILPGIAAILLMIISIARMYGDNVNAVKDGKLHDEELLESIKIINQVLNEGDMINKT